MMFDNWSPSSALIVSLAGGAIYAANDVHVNGGKNATKILVASALFGFIVTAIDDVTHGPVGTAMAALYLFVAILNKGAPALLSLNKLVTNVHNPPAPVHHP